MQELLEFPEDYYFGKEDMVVNDKNILYQTLEKFIIKYYDYNFIVSLSGGVDSMVTLILLLNFINHQKIYTASIDYNQRKESTDEINFLKKYLDNLKVKHYSKRVDGVKRKVEGFKRKDFEETSQEIRFNLYREIINENNLGNKTIILLGHHLDDLRENIFNNFMLGRSLTDLEVMKEITLKENLYFGRPFLKYPKSEIYKIAHSNNIPYFKDTTPDWSKRGLMRQKLFPLLKEMYGNFEDNLVVQGNKSNELDKIIKKNFINNINYNVSENDDSIFISFTSDKNNDLIIWTMRLSKLLHQYGVNMISQKSLKSFLNTKRSEKFGMLSKRVMFKKINDKIILKIKKSDIV